MSRPGCGVCESYIVGHLEVKSCTEVYVVMVHSSFTHRDSFISNQVALQKPPLFFWPGGRLLLALNPSVSILISSTGSANMSSDSSIPRECFLDFMEPPNCLLSMPGNPGTSRNTSAVHTVQDENCQFSDHVFPCYGMKPGRIARPQSSCTVCILSFARADGSVSCLCHTEPLARVRGFRLTLTSKAIN